jgi:hypothetical protein
MVGNRSTYFQGGSACYCRLANRMQRAVVVQGLARCYAYFIIFNRNCVNKILLEAVVANDIDVTPYLAFRVCFLPKGRLANIIFIIVTY